MYNNTAMENPTMSLRVPHIDRVMHCYSGRHPGWKCGAVVSSRRDILLSQKAAGVHGRRDVFQRKGWVQLSVCDCVDGVGVVPKKGLAEVRRGSHRVLDREGMPSLGSLRRFRSTS